MESSRPTKRVCLNRGRFQAFALFSHPDILLRLLAECRLEAKDLARLEACCKFLKKPAGYPPDEGLSIPDLAALDMCEKRSIFKQMQKDDKDDLRQRCGGSWKLVLRFLTQGEYCYRREMSQAIAGPGHSVVVSYSGKVYTFGNNSSGQLGTGSFHSERRPVLLRCDKDYQLDWDAYLML